MLHNNNNNDNNNNNNSNDVTFDFNVLGGASVRMSCVLCVKCNNCEGDIA